MVRRPQQMPPRVAPLRPVLQTELGPGLRTGSQTRHFQAQPLAGGRLFRGITVWVRRAPGPLNPGGRLAPGPGRCCRGFTASLCLHNSARHAVSLSRTYCCPERAPGLDSAGQPLGRLESQRIGLGGAWGCPPCCTTKACGICVHTYLCMHVHTHTYPRVRYTVASCGLREEEKIRPAEAS